MHAPCFTCVISAYTYASTSRYFLFSLSSYLHWLFCNSLSDTLDFLCNEIIPFCAAVCGIFITLQNTLRPPNAWQMHCMLYISITFISEIMLLDPCMEEMFIFWVMFYSGKLITKTDELPQAVSSRIFTFELKTIYNINLLCKVNKIPT